MSEQNKPMVPRRVHSAQGNSICVQGMSKPWAVVGTTPGEVLYPDGEPASKDGEAIVRLANYGAMKVPEAFEGCAPISLALRYADEEGLHTLAGIHMTPEQAWSLASDLMRAAEITEDKAERGDDQ